MSYGELYGPAMLVQTQEEADAQWQRLVEYGMANFEKRSYEDVVKTMKSNLGYYSGYYGAETIERVQRLFKCSHPVFGKVN